MRNLKVSLANNLQTYTIQNYDYRGGVYILSVILMKHRLFNMILTPIIVVILD